MEIVMKSTIDEQLYGRVLSRTRPRPIRDDAGLEAMTAELLKLDELSEISPEQQELAELLTLLIERYEDQHYEVKQGKPNENLAAIMEHRGISQSGLSRIVGSRSLVSEALSGRRAISKALAKKLAATLRAPVELFL
jgi:HTH-type transcriptional regulator/antitoxin HigA